VSRTIAVIGLGFGDEGKGMVTATLCSQSRNPLVIRFSGGHQAGHTVVDNGIKHTFANFGCGTLQGVPTYWSSNCTVEPVGLLNELQVLVDEMGESVHELKLYINNDCPVTTPYDIQFNRKREKDMMHGSCGVGFGDTLQREEDGFHLKFSDLFNPTVLEMKLDMIRKHYGMFLDDTMLGVHTEFLEAVELLKSQKFFPSDVIIPVDRMPRRFDTYIYEGSQGLLLDQDIGFFPYVTRSSVGAGKLSQGVHLDEIYYVTRAYQTRHGYGPMAGEKKGVVLINNEGESNLDNFYQGQFRTTRLDVDLLKYAIQQDRKSMLNGARQKLVITCMDQIAPNPADSGKCYKLVEDNKTATLYVNGFVLGLKRALQIEDNIYLSWSEKSELNEWKEVT
jgi:adenylosuccinate synthase